MSFTVAIMIPDKFDDHRECLQTHSSLKILG
jgi:hypothetical protein